MSTGTIESRSPQDQSDVVVSAPAADREAVAGAVKRAREAQREWARNALARADALSAAADAMAAAKDDVVSLMGREVGKPLTESVGEHGRAVRILRSHAQAALDPHGDTIPAAPPADPRTLLMSRRRPRGVAGLITPWNFPFAIPLWKAAPAMAYGNAVVLKPASDAIACALFLEEVLAKVLPAGVFNVVTGPGAAGQAVIELADVVSFTGSTAVGLEVAKAATARGIPSQAEMGGLNASIVLPDADLGSAAKTIASAAMGYAGQKCTATGRVIVVGDAAPFTDALVAAVEALPTGDPADEGTVVGPVINPSSLDDVVGAAQEVASGGGKLATGGQRLDGPGLFVTPALATRQEPDARLDPGGGLGPNCPVPPAPSAQPGREGPSKPA